MHVPQLLTVGAPPAFSQAMFTLGMNVHAVSADLVEQPAIRQYLYALFISTSHLFCLGYGLPTMPGSLVELCVTLVSMIVGSVLFLVVVGTLPTAILEQEVSAAAQELEGDHVPLPTARCASYCTRNRIPYVLHSTPHHSTAYSLQCPSGCHRG